MKPITLKFCAPFKISPLDSQIKKLGFKISHSKVFRSGWLKELILQV